jgi:hypothetical protein
MTSTAQRQAAARQAKRNKHVLDTAKALQAVAAKNDLASIIINRRMHTLLAAAVSVKVLQDIPDNLCDMASAIHVINDMDMGRGDQRTSDTRVLVLAAGIILKSCNVPVMAGGFYHVGLLASKQVANSDEQDVALAVEAISETQYRAMLCD